MFMINALTPTIEGKAFDPGWFMLMQRLERAGRIVDEYNKRQVETVNDTPRNTLQA